MFRALPVVLPLTCRMPILHSGHSRALALERRSADRTTRNSLTLMRTAKLLLPVAADRLQSG